MFRSAMTGEMCLDNEIFRNYYLLQAFIVGGMA